MEFDEMGNRREECPHLPVSLLMVLAKARYGLCRRFIGETRNWLLPLSRAAAQGCPGVQAFTVRRCCSVAPVDMLAVEVASHGRPQKFFQGCNIDIPFALFKLLLLSEFSYPRLSRARFQGRC